MVVGRPYNLRMRRKQSPPPPSPDSPPPSSPDSPPPSPPPSCRGWHRRPRTRRLAVSKTIHQLCIAVPSPPTQSVSEAEVLQLPSPPPSEPPPPAVGYSEEDLVDISSEDEDRKPDIDNPLSGLNPPPRRVQRNETTKFSEIIACVKANLVSELTSPVHSEISTMVCSANRDFTALDCYEDDYTSFYETVKKFIELNQELLEAEKLRSGHCVVFEEAINRYEDLVVEANSAEEALYSAATSLAEAKENVVRVRQRLEELRGLVVVAEMELGQSESEVVEWESEVRRCFEFHKRTEVDMTRVGSEVDDAKKLVDEAEERCKEAIKCIELMKEELRSMGVP